MAHRSDGPASSLRMFGHVHRAMCSDGCQFEVLEEHVCACQGGLASSAWHIDQMGQPPRLGCLGMCTGQCAVVAVSSMCWRSMLALDMSAPAYTIDEAKHSMCWSRRVVGGGSSEKRRRVLEGVGGRWRTSVEHVGEARCCWRSALV